MSSLEGVAAEPRNRCDAVRLGPGGRAIQTPAEELETAGTLAAVRAPFGRIGEPRVAKESRTTFDADIKVAFARW